MISNLQLPTAPPSPPRTLSAPHPAPPSIEVGTPGTGRAAMDVYPSGHRGRHRGWLWFMIFILAATAAGLALTAQWLQQEVERQRMATVEARHRGDVLASFLLSELYADLAPLGRLDLLEKPAHQALHYYAALPAEPDTAASLAGQSVAWDRIGEILTQRGDLPRALDAYREALALAEHIANQHPEDNARRRELAVSQTKLGDAHEVRGDLAAAREAYGKALAIITRLSAAHPDDRPYRHDRALLHERLARVLSTEGNFPAALKELQGRQLILLQLTAEVPDTFEWRRELGHNYGALGDLFLTHGDRPAAQSAYQQYHEIARELAAKQPGHAEWQRDLAVSFEKLGDLRVLQGDVAGARTAYQRFAEIAARLSAQDPANLQWERDLASSEERGAALLAAQDRLPEAAVRQLRGAELLVAVATRLGTAAARAEAAAAFGRLARYRILQRQPEAAVEAAQRGLSLDGSQVRIKLNLAHGLLYSGRLTEAERVYRQNRQTTLPGEKRFDEEALAELRDFIVKGIVPPESAPVESWLKSGR